MKNKILLLLVTLLACAGCARRSNIAYSNFETKLIGTELDGSYVLRVAGRARNADDAYEQAGKEAVRDIIFKNLEKTYGDHTYLYALIADPRVEQMHEAYFAAFFADHGPYKKFTNRREKREQSSKFYKTNAQVVCITTLCVDRVGLRKKLVEDGIIK